VNKVGGGRGGRVSEELAREMEKKIPWAFINFNLRAFETG